MLSVFRRTLAAAAVVGAASLPVQAQLQFGPVKIEEFRLDFANLMMISDAGNLLGVGAPQTSASIGATLMPANVALGIYLNDKVALEPTISYMTVSPDDSDNTTITVLGVAVAYYFAGDRGKSGWFVAPSVRMLMMTDSDDINDIGIDIGYKKPMNSMVSWSFAATYRDSDMFPDNTIIGARAGVSIFLRQP